MAHPTADSTSPRRDLRLYLGLTVAALVLIGADVTLLSRAEAQPAATTVTEAPAALPEATPPPEAATPEAPISAEATPGTWDPEVGAGQACTFATDMQPVAQWQSLVDLREPIFGKRDANVTVIEFFEPNCPHCAHLLPAMQAAERQFGQQARFVYKPVVFWPRSILQTQALYAAGVENPAKFHRLMSLQMERQKPEGFSEAEVRSLAREAGMNADALITRINAGTYRGHIMAYRDAFNRTGATSVPFVIINGRPVGANRTPECIGQLIQEVARG